MSLRDKKHRGMENHLQALEDRKKPLHNRGPGTNAGLGWGNRRNLPNLLDTDDYEMLQTVAEVCAIQDILDQPP